jgi:hypothetical protein
MLRIRYVLCPHCGSPRDPNLAQPCPLCNSRRYPLIGYSYRHEARTLMTMGVVIALLALLAVALGVAAVVYLEQGLTLL